LIHGQESHGAPPGYFLVLALVTFWPGSLALAAAARLAWRARAETAVRFLTAWLVPFWLLLELVPTKLPHYVLPAYPALALLAGRALAESAITSRRHWTDLISWSIWGVVALGLAAALVAVPVHFGAGTPPIAVAVIAIAIGLAGLQLWNLWVAREPLWPGMGAALVLWAAAFGIVAPRIDALWLSRSAAALVSAQDRLPRPVVVAGYAEPSIVFLLGTATKLSSGGAEAAEIVSRLPATLVLVSNREDAAFRAALQKHGISVDALGEVSGLNYSNGRAVTLTLYETAR